MTLEEAIAISETWNADPDPWFRDLGAALQLCINSRMPPAGRYLKRDWIDAQPPFYRQAEAREIISTIGLGYYGLEELEEELPPGGPG